MRPKIQIPIALIATTVFVLNACSSNANIRKLDETKISGEIVRSDKDSIYVKRFGGETKVARNDIADVSHPGKALMWVGSSVFAGGATSVIFGALIDGKQVTTYTYTSGGGSSSSSSSTSTASGTGFYIAGGIMAGVGLILFWNGYDTYTTSKGNLESGHTALLSPAAGMTLGYGTVMYPTLTPYGTAEPIHQMKISWRF